MEFIIIENDNGLMVAQVNEHESGEDVAIRQGGVVIDAGPYHTFDDAYDAMREIPLEDREDAMDI